MKSPGPAAAYLCAAVLALAACGRSEPTATSAAPAYAPTTAPSATPASGAVAPAVPDLGDPTRWRKTADGKVIVTPDNFIRAESDLYMAAQVKDGAFGKFKHTREVAPVDKPLIVRLNRDTIYSSGVFDLDAGPVTITLPDSRGRFLSALVINEDHYNPAVFYDAGAHMLTWQDAGTRYVMVACASSSTRTTRRTYGKAMHCRMPSPPARWSGHVPDPKLGSRQPETGPGSVDRFVQHVA